MKGTCTHDHMVSMKVFILLKFSILYVFTVFNHRGYSGAFVRLTIHLANISENIKC